MSSQARQWPAPPCAAPHAAIRVLLIDDSVVVRAIIARILATSPDIVVVGQAAGAEQASRLLAAATADIILLDLEMPGMDGLAALPMLLEQGGGAKILVVSSQCAKGAEATVKALRAGAADALQKPDGFAFTARFGTELVERIRAVARPRAVSASLPAPSSPALPHKAVASAPDVIGIAASTGGVHALTQLLGALSPDVTAPILVTQHLPLAFTAIFAAQLHDASGRPVRIGATGLQPRPGEIILAPGDAHLLLARTTTLVHTRLAVAPTGSGCLPSADPMLESMARVYGPGAMAVVLSGMGRDGAEGAAAIGAAGGTVIAQDEASSVVWGMPGTVTRRGLAKAVLPPAALAAWIGDAVAGKPAWN